MISVKDIMSRLFPDLDLDSCKSLIDDGILNSFSIITLITELSNNYGIKIPAPEIVPENFNSVELIEALCDRLIKG